MEKLIFPDYAGAKSGAVKISLEKVIQPVGINLTQCKHKQYLAL